VTVALVALCAAALSACGTGLHAKTYSEVGRQDGASTDVGGRDGLAVRDLHVEPPVTGSTLEAGSAATVTGALISNGANADTLLGASSDAAATATLTVGGQQATSVAVPLLGMAPTDWAVQLSGLTTALHAGDYISVTLDFEHAGRVTLRVPVRAGDNGLGVRTPEQNPLGEK
jgi:copper(I)-binding protein